MSTAPWRSDPGLEGRFHEQYADDLQVCVHDGEPRRTRLIPEACWVRVTGVHASARFPIMPRDGGKPPLDAASAQWIDRTIYRGTLLNEPKHLTTIRQGNDVLFVVAPGVPLPLQVTPAYLEERAGWALAPCDKCGADQTMDPPTVMARTRFPDAPQGAVPVAFTAFCVCGGTMMLSELQGRPAGGGKATSAKPWWKFW
jgi:hypothetical protein